MFNAGLHCYFSGLKFPGDSNFHCLYFAKQNFSEERKKAKKKFHYYAPSSGGMSHISLTPVSDATLIMGEEETIFCE